MLPIVLSPPSRSPWARADETWVDLATFEGTTHGVVAKADSEEELDLRAWEIRSVQLPG